MDRPTLDGKPCRQSTAQPPGLASLSTGRRCPWKTQTVGLSPFIFPIFPTLHMMMCRLYTIGTHPFKHHRKSRLRLSLWKAAPGLFISPAPRSSTLAISLLRRVFPPTPPARLSSTFSLAPGYLCLRKDRYGASGAGLSGGTSQEGAERAGGRRESFSQRIGPGEVVGREGSALNLGFLTKIFLSFISIHLLVCSLANKTDSDAMETMTGVSEC